MNKNNFMKYFLLVVLQIFFFSACQKEDLMDKTAGFQISLQEGDVVIETKSTPGELGKPTSDKFMLNITNEATQKVLYDGAYTAQTIAASAGTYSIFATFGKNEILALDAPYYSGDTVGVEIKDGEKKSIKLQCKVANALASVVFPTDAELKKIFSAYWVKVVVEGQSCNLTPDSKKSAYFQTGKPVSFYFEGTKTNGESFSELLKNDGLKSTWEAGDHVKITLKLSDDLLLDIAKVEVKKETITANIPMDWLPKPKIVAEGFVNNMLSFAETESKTAKLNFNTALALQDLKLKFDFKDPQFTSLNDKEYKLSVPEDKKMVEETLGIILPEIGTEKASLDLTSVVAKLQTNAGETVTNTVEVDVMSNGRWSSEVIVGQENPSRVYTLECKKPEMILAVQPENVWTKEFTVDELTVKTGNPEVIKSNLKYQYKDKSGNDDSWKDIQDLKVLFDEHPQNKSYQVRAVYRDVIMTDVVDVELETPIQLPNSGMEEWSYSESSSNNGNEGSIFNPKYTYIPIYTLGSNWSTNNTYTTRYSNKTFGRPYNCFPAVSYVPGRNEGRAAELRSTAAGRGNTKAVGHTELDLNKVAGELFLGEIEIIQGGTDADPKDDHYEIKKGKDFYSRPSALSFWYKYIPCNSDTWKVSIELLDEAREVIVSKTYQSSDVKSEYTELTLPLDYQESVLYKKCRYIYIVFSSTINTGSSLQYNTVDYTLWKDNNQVKFNNTYVGSILTIDDISLVYDK